MNKRNLLLIKILEKEKKNGDIIEKNGGPEHTDFPSPWSQLMVGLVHACFVIRHKREEVARGSGLHVTFMGNIV